jgi:hypothetical protein
MLFLRAKVIPVNPQIHGNVMCPLFVLNFIFEPLFVHAPDITSSLAKGYDPVYSSSPLASLDGFS